jgi:8-amino-7-oxononanoate synthase
MEDRLKEHLDRRRREGTLRSLMRLPKIIDTKNDQALSSSTSSALIDFASNDYLGLARCKRQHALVQSAYDYLFTPNIGIDLRSPMLGASGSRLLSGDSHLARSLEAKLADVHNRPAALLFNSGYDANLSVLSSLPYREDDAIVMDELVHNSLVMGVRMGRLRRERVYMFRHNDVVDLRRVLNHVASSSSSLSSTLVVVESVYSMDGDIAPLKSILELAKDMGAGVMVDEAHGLGVYGHTNTKNLEMISTDGDDGDIENDVGDLQTQGGAGVLAALNLERHPALLCSIHTFGKAAGCHGAIVAGSSTLIAYLVNYARPFVYSTALPPHSLVSIQQAYKSMMGVEGERRRTKVFRLVRYFREGISANLNADFPGSDFELLPSPSPIQALVVPGNEQCISVCQYLRNVGFDVYAIRSPTVTKGKERIRIILHAHNNEDEVSALMKMLVVALKQLSFPDRLNVISKL